MGWLKAPLLTCLLGYFLKVFKLHFLCFRFCFLFREGGSGSRRLCVCVFVFFLAGCRRNAPTVIVPEEFADFLFTDKESPAARSQGRSGLLAHGVGPHRAYCSVWLAYRPRKVRNASACVRSLYQDRRFNFWLLHSDLRVVKFCVCPVCYK